MDVVGDKTRSIQETTNQNASRSILVLVVANVGPIVHVGCLLRMYRSSEVDEQGNQSSLKGECGTKGGIMLLVPGVRNKYLSLHVCGLSCWDARHRCCNDSETKEAKVFGLTRIDSRVRDFDETGEEDEVYPSCCAH